MKQVRTVFTDVSKGRPHGSGLTYTDTCAQYAANQPSFFKGRGGQGGQDGVNNRCAGEPW